MQRCEIDPRLFSLGPAIIVSWRLAPGYPVMALSENGATLFGDDTDELSRGRIPYIRLVHPEDRAAYERTVETCREGGIERCRHEPYRIQAGGAERWVQQYSIFLSDDAEPDQFAGYLFDITEQRASEQARADSETCYRTLWNSLHDAALIADMETGRIVEANRSAEKLLGRPREQLIGMHQSELHPLEQRERYRERFAAHIAQGRAADYDGEVVRADGRRIPVYVTAAPLGLRGRRWILGLFHDLAERTRIEEELRVSETLLSEAERLAHIGSWEWEIASGRVIWSEEVFRLFGVDRAGFAATFDGYLALCHPEDRPRLEAAVRRALDGAPYLVEHRIIRQDGEVRHLHCEGKVVWQGDRPVRMFGTVQDLTDRIRWEREMSRTTGELTHKSRRLERVNRELQQFAYVVSHDLKAPLRAVSYIASTLAEDLAGCLSGEAARRMNKLVGRVSRMDHMVDALLEYSEAGSAPARLTEFDSGDLVRGMVAEWAIPPGFRVSVEAMPRVTGDREALRRVFAELLRNAIEHHPGPEGEVRIGGGEEQEGLYRFSVADDGPGIPERYRSRVFELFQTLEARDRVERIGIGLALVKKLVEMNGGSVWLDSPDGRGTLVRFTWARPGGTFPTEA